MEKWFDMLVTRLGFKAFGGLAVVGFVVWLAAHLVAEPGHSVSVLWGLVEYTKALGNEDPDGPTSSRPVFVAGPVTEPSDLWIRGVRVHAKAWHVKPPRHFELVLGVEGETENFAGFRALAMCRVDDATVDFLSDVNIQRSALFLIREPEITISVPLSSEFLVQLALRGRKIRCRVGAIPSDLSPAQIRNIGDIVRLGGELFPLGPGMTLSPDSFHVRLAPGAPPEAEKDAEELLKRMRE